VKTDVDGGKRKSKKKGIEQHGPTSFEQQQSSESLLADETRKEKYLLP